MPALAAHDSRRYLGFVISQVSEPMNIAHGRTTSGASDNQTYSNGHTLLGSSAVVYATDPSYLHKSQDTYMSTGVTNIDPAQLQKQSGQDTYMSMYSSLGASGVAFDAQSFQDMQWNSGLQGTPPHPPGKLQASPSQERLQVTAQQQQQQQKMQPMQAVIPVAADPAKLKDSLSVTRIGS